VSVPAVPAARGGQAKLAAIAKTVGAAQSKLASHPPGSAAAAAAQAAAVAPANDKVAHGKAVNAEKMHKAEPGEFDKAAFIKAVEEAIAAQAPKNLEQAEDYATSGKADAVKDQVSGQVKAGMAQSAGPISEATEAPPDTGAVSDKPVTPLAEDKPPAAPAPPDPALAVPDKAPPEATDFSEGPRQVEQQMADAEVSDETLASSGESQFTEALAAKKEGEAHAAAAPAQLRASEAGILSATKSAAGRLGGSTMVAMQAARAQAGKAVAAGQQQKRTADESRRAQVAARLQAVFDGTKKAVEEILSGLDKKVDEKFTAEEKGARDAFTAEHQRGMAEYKDKRYSGIGGGLRWASDKLFDLPEEAHAIFDKARQGYVARMKDVIASVADLIGAELGRARARIAEGRTELKAEVDKLPEDLKAVGREKAGEFEQRFDELGQSVKNKGQGLVQTLATRYTDAVGKVDEEIAAEKEKNKGLVSRAVAAVGGVIKTIRKLKDMLLGVLAKAASAVMAIIKDPIGFLGNLVSAVGAGLQAFLSNIVKHLKKGLFSWLLGAASEIGLELPKTFDLRGIFGMLATMFGLTWAAIRGRIVQRALKLGIPQGAIGAIEAGVTLVQKLRTHGMAGVIEEVKEKIGDLKDNLVGKLTEYLVPSVLKAGIFWILSLLNPATAFVKACKAIVDFVTFVVERGAQIMEFVGSVLDAVVAIAKGGGGGVPALVEKALARSVPVLIGALAALLGLGGVANKVKEFFQSLSKPVHSAVEWVVDKVVTLGKGIWARMKGAVSRKAGKSKKARPSAKDIVRRLLTAGRSGQKRLHSGGESHTLSVGQRGDSLVIYMASEKAPLPETLRKLADMVRRFETSTPGPVKSDVVKRWKGALRGAQKKGQEIEESWRKFVAARRQEKNPDPNLPPTFKQQVDLKLAEIAAGLEPLGPLSPAGAAAAAKLKKLKGEEFRKYMYRVSAELSSWKAVRVRIIRRDLPDILGRITNIIWPLRRARLAAKPGGTLTPVELASRAQSAKTRLKELLVQGFLPKAHFAAFESTGDIDDATLRSTAYWDVDHRVPLTAHWSAIGYNSDDSTRFAAATSDENLEMIAQGDNRSARGAYKGSSGNYSKEPGPQFTTNVKLP
jgi:hypothetical protein